MWWYIVKLICVESQSSDIFQVFTSWSVKMLICDLWELILFSCNNTVDVQIGHFCECFNLAAWNCVRNSHWLRLRFDRQASTLVATEKSTHRSRAWCEGHTWCVGRGESENSIYSIIILDWLIFTRSLLCIWVFRYHWWMKYSLLWL